MNWFVSHFISACLLPPLNLILLGGVGVLFLKSRPKLGKRLVALSLVLLYIISTPFFSERAMRAFEGPYVDISDRNADAIVVLGAGSYFHAPEYEGANTVSPWALERLRYAAKLYRKTRKPILVTGGAPLGNADSEALQMKTVLVEDFHVPVTWTEEASIDTEGNASKSAVILKQHRTIYLVTHAWHMPRASTLFRHAGFSVIPAPTGYATSNQTGLLSFLPAANALWKSEILMHEIIGLAWFELKYRLHGNREKS
ncbi:MAG: YdcF family protein [Burkholderiales bacterium]|nr:YdcF family protein [Burkholderiales bacterium]